MFENFVDVVKTVGGLASCIMSIGALITLFVKPIREKILMTSKERDAQKECDKCLLRNEITDFYYSHKDNKVIAERQFENIDKLYHAYKMLGGNSFVEKIYTEMRDSWEIKGE